jgi:hypothetical protein
LAVDDGAGDSRGGASAPAAPASIESSFFVQRPMNDRASRREVGAQRAALSTAN